MGSEGSGFVNVDALMREVSFEQVLAHFDVPLAGIQRIGSEIRMRCILKCGRTEETGDRAIAVQAALEGLTDEEVFAEIQARRGFALEQPKSVKQAELETLVASKEEIGNDRPDGNFFARAVPKATWSKPWMLPIERVVLVHRLREVVAQVGFTRFEAAAPDIEGELEIGVRRATLAREITWLPAIENKGEGNTLAE